MEKEIQKTIKQLSRDQYELEKELEEPVELDELELEKYIELVVKEVRKGSKALITSILIIYSNSDFTLLIRFGIVTGFLIKHPILNDGYCSLNAS
jgi:hypothetical protein